MPRCALCVLTQLGVEFVVADVMAELRNVLPEVCVIWLISEEPKLLHGIPLQRLEQVMSAQINDLCCPNKE